MDVTPIDRLPYFPFDGREFRFEMGLAPLAIGDWIEFDGDAGSQLRQRAELLTTSRDQVLQYLDEAETACFELNQVLREHLLDLLPGHVSGSLAEIRVRESGAVFKEPQSGGRIRIPSSWPFASRRIPGGCSMGPGSPFGGYRTRANSGAWT